MDTYRGYMIEAVIDGDVLVLHGTNKAARVALAGEDHAQDVVVPLGSITRTEWKSAGPLVNGRLVVHADGRRYQVHFRRKHQGDMERLADRLGVVRA